MPSILAAGPICDAEGYCASALIYKAETREQAERLLLDDPYHRAGIFASYTVEEWKPVAGAWVGGAAWKQTKN